MYYLLDKTAYNALVEISKYYENGIMADDIQSLNFINKEKSKTLRENYVAFLSDHSYVEKSYVGNDTKVIIRPNGYVAIKNYEENENINNRNFIITVSTLIFSGLTFVFSVLSFLMYF